MVIALLTTEKTGVPLPPPHRCFAFPILVLYLSCHLTLLSTLPQVALMGRFY